MWPFDGHDLSRRDLVQGAGAVATGLGLGLATSRVLRGGGARPIPGRVLGPSVADGHRVRGARPAGEPSRVERVDVVVAGGGIAGLAAARALRRAGVSRVTLLELEDTTGGNSRSGGNHVTKYPWGAHYVPIVNQDVEPLRDLLVDFGVITSSDARGVPTYDEVYLCSDPVERLFLHGRWREGIYPSFGQSSDDAAQADKFRALVRAAKRATGRDGKRAFAMPVDQSTDDPVWRELDKVSMGAYLAAHGFTSPRLRWYVDYCCRDDYGAGADKVSAWAGLYYFAARTGTATNAPAGSLLTWPEGNGWLAERLAADVAVQSRSLVVEIADGEKGATVDHVDLASGELVRTEARYAVCALPHLVAGRVVKDRAGSRPKAIGDFDYAPWVVANLTLSSPPTNERSSPLAWDNVSYHGKSLGYVVANHQSLRTGGKETVITHYQPMDAFVPHVARQVSQTLSHFDWQTLILADLEDMHPGISSAVMNLDVWVWGHGMILPKPGLIWGGARSRGGEPVGNVHFAHSDLAGASVFEEAFLLGHATGDRIARLLKRESA